MTWKPPFALPASARQAEKRSRTKVARATDGRCPYRGRGALCCALTRSILPRPRRRQACRADSGLPLRAWRGAYGLVCLARGPDLDGARGAHRDASAARCHRRRHRRGRRHRGPMAALGVPGRVTAAGLDWNLDVSVAMPYVGVEGVTLIAFVANVVWNNLVSIVLFAGLLTAAILLRSNAQAHKRLIVIASMLNVLPAAARISRWPGLGGEDSPFIPGVLIGLLLSVLVYDIVTRRRPQKATLSGTGAIAVSDSPRRLESAV